MEAIYLILFAAFAVPAVLLECSESAAAMRARRRGGGSGKAAPVAAGASPDYVRFRNNYVAVFSLMMAGDWLQGPYVYHLYEYYGFGVRDIGRLFIAGFGSSAVFGTLAGALADRRGRRRAALLYVGAYCLSCLAKHSSSYRVLLVGRLLGGVATSLLFSVFESWAVAAHARAGFPESLLPDLFTRAVFLGNGVMAIASGLLGNALVEGLGLGPVAPFDAAIVVLLAGGAAIAATWEENYGERPASAAAAGGGGALAAVGAQFWRAARCIRHDPRVALLGASQALFEASMYTWVFLWTPALSPDGEQLPHGFVFAIFMTASMVGTALAGKLMRRVRLERLMQVVFWLSAVSLFVPAMFHMQRHSPLAAADAPLLAYDDYGSVSGSSVPGGGGGTGGSRGLLGAGGGTPPVAAAGGSSGGGGHLTHGSSMAAEGPGGGGAHAGSGHAALPHIGSGQLAAMQREVINGLASLGHSIHDHAAAAHNSGGSGGDGHRHGAEGQQPATRAGGSAGSPPASSAAASTEAPAAELRRQRQRRRQQQQQQQTPEQAPPPPPLGVAGRVQLVVFCVFEVLIGIFWPCMMTLRARYVPDQQRSTIINIFRIPLNVFVCMILWKVSDVPLGVVFALCSLFLAAAACCQHRLAAISSGGRCGPKHSLSDGGGGGGGGGGDSGSGSDGDGEEGGGRRPGPGGRVANGAAAPPVAAALVRGGSVGPAHRELVIRVAAQWGSADSDAVKHR